MAEKIASKNSQISNTERLVTLPLTLDRVTLHTVVITHRLLLTCQISLKSKTYCELTDRHLRPALLGRLCQSRPKNQLRGYVHHLDSKH